MASVASTVRFFHYCRGRSGILDHMTSKRGQKDQKQWYAVRCIFEWHSRLSAEDRVYEERITLWRTKSWKKALKRAEDEARRYAKLIESEQAYLGTAQAYLLPDPPRQGAEVFSLVRISDLGPTEYIDAFFDSGSERQGSL